MQLADLGLAVSHRTGLSQPCQCTGRSCTSMAAHEALVLQAAELARALRNLPDDVKLYKTIAAFEGQAIEYLDRCAQGVQHLSRPQHMRRYGSVCVA